MRKRFPGWLLLCWLVWLAVLPSAAQVSQFPTNSFPNSTLPRTNSPTTTPRGTTQPKPTTPKPPDDTGDYFGNAVDAPFGSTPWSTPNRFNPLTPNLYEHKGIGYRRTGDRNFSVSGSGELGMNWASVSGERSTFNNDQYNKQHTLTEQASLLMTGPIWKWANLHLHAQLDQRSFGFNDTRPVWRLFWEDQNNRITVGDINPSLGQGNSFVQFGRRLSGIMAEGKLGGRLEYVAFGSQVQGSVRSETFVGNGTPGPYFLTYTPVADGSAIVLLDGVVQQAGYGDTGDYTLNPTTGELNFNGARIIAPSQRIEVRYETLGNSGPKDLLLGTRLQATVTRFMHMGLSYVGQLAGNSSSLNGPVETRVTDQLTVPTPSPGPFTLRARPILPASESVIVNGILQKRDVDYQINYTTGELQFFQALAEGTSIVVRFTVKQSVDLGAGDRNVLGLDTSITLGDALMVSLEAAFSQGTPSARSNPFSLGGSTDYGSGYDYTGLDSGLGTTYGTGTTGSTLGSTNYGSGLGSNFGSGSSSGLGSFRRAPTYARARQFGSTWAAQTLARQTTGTTSTRDTQTASGHGGSAYKVLVASHLGDVQLQADYKSISDNFARVDSTGFFQNESGFNLAGSYTPGSTFSLTAQLSHQSRPYDTTSTVSGTATTVRSRVNSDLKVASINWRFGPQSQLQFLYNAQSNGGGGSSNDVSRLGMSINHGFSRELQVTAGVDLSSSGTSGTASGTTAAQSNDTNSLTGRAGIGYNTPGGRLTTRLDYSFSKSTASTTSNNASNIVASLGWQALKQLSFQFSHQLSDSSNKSNYTRPTTTSRWAWWRDRADGVAIDPLTGLPIGASSDVANKTQSTNISVLTMPLRDVNLTFTWNHSVTDNGRLASNTSDSLQSNLHYQISDAIGLGFGWNTQNLRYTDSGDSTSTNVLNATFDWRINKFLDMRSDWQSMATKNKYASTSTSTTDTTSQLGTSPDSSFSSLGTDLRWQLPGGRFATFAGLRLDSSGGGLQTFSRFSLQTGWDCKLTSILGLRLAYEYTDYAAKGTQSSGTGSYVSHLLNASLGARF